MNQEILSAKEREKKNKEGPRPKSTSSNELRIEGQETSIDVNKQPIFRVNENLKELIFDLGDQAYHTHSQLLAHTKIRPQDRQRLKSWILSQTQNLYHRQTYAMASKYLDIFFANGHKVSKSSFQVLGISCLMLASKVNERKIPNISFEVFDKTEIFNFQRELFKAFNYKMFPTTYVTLMELVLQYWDNFESNNHPFKELKFYKEESQSIKRVRTLMETLDCMDLVTETLDIPLENVVLNVFMIESRRFCLEAYRKEMQDSQTSLFQTDSEHRFSLLFESTIQDFFKNLVLSLPIFAKAKINYKDTLYTMCFSRLNPKIEVAKKIKNLRLELCRQTYSPQISLIAQQYISRTR